MKKRRTNDFMIAVFRIVADPFVTVLSKSTITPNQITFLNFIIFTPILAYLFFLGGFWNNMLALFIIVINTFFDVLDGGVARKKNMQSKLGEWMENGFDPLTQMIILFSITLHILIQYSGENWKYLALLPLLGQSMANMLGQKLNSEFGLDFAAGNEQLYKLFTYRKSFADNFLKNMLIPSNLIYSVFFTAKYYLLIGIFFNILHVTYIIFGFFILLRLLFLYLIFSLYYSNLKLENKYATFKFLRKYKR